jgi:hypothetical protein
VIALATDCGRPDGLPAARDLPIFKLDDLAAVAAFIAALCGAAGGTAEPEAGSGTRRHATAQR